MVPKKHWTMTDFHLLHACVQNLNTALSWAAKYASAKTLTLLISLASDINVKNTTVILF